MIINEILTKPPQSLLTLKDNIANIAQKCYDNWDQNDEGYDEELNYGGICHIVAYEICEFLAEKGFDCDTVNSSVGENHNWVVVKTDNGVFTVDIPPDVYEEGLGYVWRKKPNININPTDVQIELLDPDPQNFEDYIDDF